MIGRTAQAIALVCLVLTGVAAVQVRWLQEPAVMCPDDAAMRSLAVYRASANEAEPPAVGRYKGVEFRARGRFKPHADEPGWLNYKLGRNLSPSWYIVSGLKLSVGNPRTSDVTVRASFDRLGRAVPVSFREHRSNTPPLVTGTLFLFDGEPVSNPALAAVWRAIRSPLSPPAAVTGISLGYWESDRDIERQKVEILHWMDRFVDSVQEACR